MRLKLADGHHHGHLAPDRVDVCTLGLIPAIISLAVAKHVLVAILVMDLGVDAPQRKRRLRSRRRARRNGTGDRRAGMRAAWIGKTILVLIGEHPLHPCSSAFHLFFEESRSRRADDLALALFQHAFDLLHFLPDEQHVGQIEVIALGTCCFHNQIPPNPARGSPARPEQVASAAVPSFMSLVSYTHFAPPPPISVQTLNWPGVKTM